MGPAGYHPANRAGSGAPGERQYGDLQLGGQSRSGAVGEPDASDRGHARQTHRVGIARLEKSRPGVVDPIARRAGCSRKRRIAALTRDYFFSDFTYAMTLSTSPPVTVATGFILPLPAVITVFMSAALMA